MFERNYAMDNFLTAYFNVPWPAYFTNSTLQAQLYLALVAQALLVKSDISTRRARNSWGTVTWQLGEIWPTGGWGALEYGTVGFTSGQVLGGRWKPVMHYMAQHLYTDLFVVCGADARCLVKNDGPLTGFSGSLVLSVLDVTSGTSHELLRRNIQLPAGGGAAVWQCADGSGSPPKAACAGWPALLAPLGLAPNNTVLFTTLVDGTSTTTYTSFELLATPADMLHALPADPAVVAVVGAAAPDGKSVPVTVSAAGTALFVGLTTAAHGRFSDNFFVLAEGQRVVQFLPFGALDVDTLKATLRVEHVRSYL